MTSTPNAGHVSPKDLTFCVTIIKTDAHHGAVRMAIRGDLDAATAGTVTELTTNTLTRLPHTLVVDLAEVPFLDAAGVRTLLRGYLPARSRHIRFRIFAAQRLVRHVLEVTGAWDTLTGQQGRPTRPHPRRAADHQLTTMIN